MDNAHEVEHAAASAQVAAAVRLARIIVAAGTVCADSGAPLSDRQKVSLLTAALLEFDGNKAEVHGVLGLEELLARFDGNGGLAE
jgi:hypothetical protein